MATENETFVTGLLDAFNEGRFDDYADGFAEDAVISYPQSGERIAGRENIRAMFWAFASPPRFAVTRTRACGDDVVVEADGDYGAGAPWKVVLLYTLAGGSVVAETGYFGAPFEAAEWRKPFTAAS